MAISDRGFASMPRAQRSRIASLGGKAAHRNGKAHEWTGAEAKAAGAKGGRVTGQRRREAKAREAGGAAEE
jgi:hypothetical protein